LQIGMAGEATVLRVDGAEHVLTPAARRWLTAFSARTMYPAASFVPAQGQAGARLRRRRRGSQACGRFARRQPHTGSATLSPAGFKAQQQMKTEGASKMRGYSVSGLACAQPKNGHDGFPAFGVAQQDLAAVYALAVLDVLTRHDGYGHSLAGCIEIGFGHELAKQIATCCALSKFDLFALKAQLSRSGQGLCEEY
jgi:hypothetical protein